MSKNMTVLRILIYVAKNTSVKVIPGYTPSHTAWEFSSYCAATGIFIVKKKKSLSTY